MPPLVQEENTYKYHIKKLLLDFLLQNRKNKTKTVEEQDAFSIKTLREVTSLLSVHFPWSSTI